MPSISLIRPCPPDEPGAPCINDWIYVAACTLKRSKVEQSRAVDMLRSAMTRKEKFPREVERQVERAYGVASAPPRQTARKADTQPFNADLLIERAKQIDQIITREWLALRSPIDPVNLTPERFLDAIFSPGENVHVTTAYNAPGRIYKACGSESKQLLQPYLSANSLGAWFIVNPTDGRGKKSSNIAGWRYCLLESDEEGFEQCWLRMLVQEPLQIVSLIESGNTSVHALVRLDAVGATDFASKTNSLAGKYVPLGACRASLITDERLTRLANVTRGDNQRSQRLLYLNPSADATPILHRETFEPLF